MSIRVARLVLGVVAAIIVTMPLMPRVALSHEGATVRFNFSTLAYYAADPEASEATLDSDMYRLLDLILSLDDEQVTLFQQALDVAGDHEALKAFLLANGPEMLAIASAMPESRALQAAPGETQEPQSGEERQLLDHCGTADPLSSSWWECFLGHIVVDPISSLINGISSTVNTIVTKADQIISDIGTFLQDAVDKIAQFGQDVMNFFHDVSDAAFGWISEIRSRYLAWVGSGCDAASSCGQFRAHLATFFAQIVSVEESIAAMIGPVAIRLPGVPNNQTAIQEAMSAIPDFLIWPLAEVLDLLPVNWYEIPSRIGAMLPVVGPNAMTPWEIINDAVNSPEPFDMCSYFALDGSGAISPLPHANVDVYAMSLLTSGLGIIEAYIPNDLTIDVLGEGTTIMSHPLKMVFTPIKQFVDLMGTAMGQINDIDTVCATEAFRQAVIDALGGLDSTIADLGGAQFSNYVEDQLSSCTVIVSLYLPATNGGNLEMVRDLVDDFISQVEAAGLSSNGARTLHDQGLADIAAGEYRRAYLDFCSSYRLLRYGEEIGALYQGTGEIWACINNFTGQMRHVERIPTLQPGDPGYYTPPVNRCAGNERLVEMYGYRVVAAQ